MQTKAERSELQKNGSEPDKAAVNKNCCLEIDIKANGTDQFAIKEMMAYTVAG